MRGKKIKATKIIAITTVGTVLWSTSISSAQELSTKKNKESSVVQSSLVNRVIKVNVGSIQIEKNSSSGITTNEAYIPENVVPSTGDIGTIGTSFKYKIPIEFTSLNGKLYNLKETKIDVQLNPSGVMGKGLTKAQQLGVEQLQKAINIEIPKYSHQWNTSGSYVFSVLIKLNNALNGVQLNPVMKLEYKLNGIREKQDVSLGKILLTRKYTTNIVALPTIKNNNLEIGVNCTSDNGSVAKYDINNLGYINANHKLKSLTFKLLAPEGVSLNPIFNKELIKNSNGTYTVEENLLSEMLKAKIPLFKINYENKVVDGSIGIELIPKSNGITFENGAETDKGTNVNYKGGNTSITYIPKGNSVENIDKFKLESSDHGIVIGQGNMTNAIKTDFSAKVNLCSGSGIVYVGSCITNGQGVIRQNNINIASKDLTYVQLPKDILNSLTKGTVKEKANIMSDIINNKYPTYSVGDDLKPGFEPNFIYKKVKVEEGKSTVISGNYVKIPMNYDGWSYYPKTASSTIVGIVYDNNENIIKDFKESSSDGIEKTKNGLLLGIVSPQNNLINSTLDKASAWEYAQSTSFRDGEFSHGVSASAILTWAISDTRFDSFDSGITTYNERGHGISNQCLNIYKGQNWLSSPHTINGVMGVNVAGTNNLYKAGSYIKVNFGANAIVIGNVLLDGKVVDKNNLKIENDCIIIKLPKDTKVNLLKVTIPIQYTDMSIESLTTWMAPCTSNGDVEREIYPVTKINGSMSSWGMTGYGLNTAFTNTVNLTDSTANICGQYSNGVSKDNTTTITNIVSNLGSENEKYTIAGRIPTNGNDALPTNFGDSSIGDLSSTLENIETNGADTWVLPNSKLNSPENREILNNPDTNTLEGLTKEKLEQLGWIKYKSKMDLKNIGAYLVKVEIKPSGSYTMHYKIKLSNVDIKKFQATSVGYKYCNNNNSIGGVSPIITLTPNGEDDGDDWISSIVVQQYGKNGKGQIKVLSSSKMPQNILNEKIVTANDKINSSMELKDLISYGTDIGKNKKEKTPEKLMKLIDFAINNNDAFKKIGYKLDYISFNGVNIAKGDAGEYSMNKNALLNWLENVGISSNTVLTKVKFVMSPIKDVQVTVEVKVLGENGQVINNSNDISKHRVLTGVAGEYLNSEACKITVPKGYKLVKETVNNIKIVPDASGVTLPQKIDENGDQIIYYIQKIEKEHTKQEIPVKPGIVKKHESSVTIEIPKEHKNKEKTKETENNRNPAKQKVEKEHKNKEKTKETENNRNSAKQKVEKEDKNKEKTKEIENNRNLVKQGNNVKTENTKKLETIKKDVTLVKKSRGKEIENPETGDESNKPFVLIILTAIIGLFLLNKKKIRNFSNGKNRK